MSTRRESDSLGAKDLPSDRLYGIYTARVMENYQISDSRVPLKFIRNYIRLKAVYAKVNQKNNKLDKQKAKFIIQACEYLIEKSDESLKLEFDIDVIQSGGGTSVNMAVNEVIANTAEEAMNGNRGEYKLIHPNDHVNMSQSSNDTFPSVGKITVYQLINNGFIAELLNLSTEFSKKSEDFKRINKVGRTHLQDALKITVGNELSAYARILQKATLDIKRSLTNCTELPLGATALGNMQNINDKIRKDIIKEISAEFKVDFAKPENYYEATSSSSDFYRVSSTIASLSNDLIKICNDLRLLVSGPKSGISEYNLPSAQPGSSIMPGKVNPSIPEAVTMAAFRALGLHHTIELATQAAQLQLQAFMPSVVFSLLESITILQNAIKILKEKSISGLSINEEALKQNLNQSFVYATEYSEKYGYDKVAELVKRALKEDRELHELIAELG